MRCSAPKLTSDTFTRALNGLYASKYFSIVSTSFHLPMRMICESLAPARNMLVAIERRSDFELNIFTLSVSSSASRCPVSFASLRSFCSSLRKPRRMADVMPPLCVRVRRVRRVRHHEPAPNRAQRSAQRSDTATSRHTAASRRTTPHGRTKMLSPQAVTNSKHTLRMR
jgi:hypothetical protein